jgi:6,7-dimethyl-8-ribityllumazine synthase
VNELEGTPNAPGQGRVALIVSRYNELVTGRLLEGARTCLREYKVPEDQVDLIWTAGAFELPVVAAEAAASRRYGAIIAIGCVMRGETPHFEYVAQQVAGGLGAVAREHRIAVGFGVLTTDSPAQAFARAGGEAGNKGYEAADAALRTADLLAQLHRAPAGD